MADRNTSRIVDKKWVKIFDKYDVLDTVKRDGSFTITSSQINEFKEARLMTKFDYLTSLPDIFHRHKLAILPTKRGEYVIGYFDAYFKMQTKDKDLLKDRKEIEFPAWIETIEPRDITSESTMLNAASVSGMIADLFNENETEVAQTISGRRSSKQFSFKINNQRSGGNYTLNIENSQMEIDGGFETPDKLILFEAKNNTTDSFMIRQLYYPYQLWAKEKKKQVVPVFLQYSDNTFNFSVFDFEDVYDYNSLKLIERKNYIFGAEHTTLNDIVMIQKSIKIVKEDPAFPFPQADTFTRVIGIVEAIRESDEGYITLEGLTIENDFVMRQAQYYSRAALYLGLVERMNQGNLKLSAVGREYSKISRKERNLLIARRILEHKAFNVVFKRGIERGKPLSAKETLAYLLSTDFYEPHLSDTTRRRRSSTISSWVKYLFAMTDDY